jgi:hypothetical protein
LIGLVLALLLAFLSLPALPAWGQSPPRISMNDLTLSWLIGDYVGTVVCRIDGKPVRGVRRVKIEPGPRDRRPPIALIHLIDFEIEEASRCFSELGATVPNLVGSLEIRHGVTKPRSTVQRDFKAELRREKGFEYRIVEGKVTMEEAREGENRKVTINFRGGSARAYLVRRGTDSSRLLSDLPGTRKITLELISAEGRAFILPLAMSDEGRRR